MPPKCQAFSELHNITTKETILFLYNYFSIGRVSSIERYTYLHQMCHIILQAQVIQWIQHVEPVPMHIEPSVMDTVTQLL